MMRETVDWLMPKAEATQDCVLPSNLTQRKIRWASPSGCQRGAEDGETEGVRDGETDSIADVVMTGSWKKRSEVGSQRSEFPTAPASVRKCMDRLGPFHSSRKKIF